MAGDPNVPTSPTLLGRRGRAPAGRAAWGQFAERYGRKIYGRCRRWGLQEEVCKPEGRDPERRERGP
jgi:hypothetical protein